MLISDADNVKEKVIELLAAALTPLITSFDIHFDKS